MEESEVRDENVGPELGTFSLKEKKQRQNEGTLSTNGYNSHSKHVMTYEVYSKRHVRRQRRRWRE
jgi:hypothetical protein